MKYCLKSAPLAAQNAIFASKTCIIEYGPHLIATIAVSGTSSDNVYTSVVNQYLSATTITASNTQTITANIVRSIARY
jgi:hypothetical protein